MPNVSDEIRKILNNDTKFGELMRHVGKTPIGFETKDGERVLTISSQKELIELKNILNQEKRKDKLKRILNDTL